MVGCVCLSCQRLIHVHCICAVAHSSTHSTKWFILVWIESFADTLRLYILAHRYTYSWFTLHPNTNDWNRFLVSIRKKMRVSFNVAGLGNRVIPHQWNRIENEDGERGRFEGDQWNVKKKKNERLRKSDWLGILAYSHLDLEKRSESYSNMHWRVTIFQNSK